MARCCQASGPAIRRPSSCVHESTAVDYSYFYTLSRTSTRRDDARYVLDEACQILACVHQQHSDQRRLLRHVARLLLKHLIQPTHVVYRRAASFPTLVDSDAFLSDLKDVSLRSFPTMTCDVSVSVMPPLLDPLPAYSPRRAGRDSDVTSVHSNAPSYTSAAPSYHSRLPLTPNRAEAGRGRGRAAPLISSTTTCASSPPPRPQPHFAPGFTPRGPGSARMSDLASHTNQIPSWSPVGASTPQSRHYHSVALASAATMINNLQLADAHLDLL